MKKRITTEENIIGGLEELNQVIPLEMIDILDYGAYLMRKTLNVSFHIEKVNPIGKVFDVSIWQEGLNDTHATKEYLSEAGLKKCALALFGNTFPDYQFGLYPEMYADKPYSGVNSEWVYAKLKECRMTLSDLAKSISVQYRYLEQCLSGTIPSNLQASLYYFFLSKKN